MTIGYKKVSPLLFMTLWIVSLLNCDLRPIPEPDEDNSIYGFETDKMDWIPSPFPMEPAIISVHQTTSVSYLGSGSLMILVDLIGKTKSRGTAFVEMEKHPPKGVTIPVDLQGIEISGWIYATEGLSGNKDMENYITLYVTDNKYRPAYGHTIKIIEKEWFKISVIPDSVEHDGGSVHSGFDPTSIIYIGLLIQMNYQTAEDSTCHNSGCIYLDAVDWK